MTFDIRLAALVGLGSGIGGVFRYAIAAVVPRSTFPWATLGVNLVGSFLIGVVLFGGAAGHWLRPRGWAFLAVGVLGGFTTMSAFAFDTLFEVHRGAVGVAAAYVAVTVVGCLLAVWAGRAVGLAL